MGKVTRRREHLNVIAFLYAMMLVGCIIVALEPGPAPTASTVRVTAAVIGLTLAIFIVRTLRAGVKLLPDGVLIRNVTTMRRLAWDEIERFELGTWRGWGTFPCGVARLRAGGQVTIFALNPSIDSLDPVPALLERLNGELARARGVG